MCAGEGTTTGTAPRPCAGVGEGLPAGLRRSCPGPIAQRDAIHRTTTWCIGMTYCTARAPTRRRPKSTRLRNRCSYVKRLIFPVSGSGRLEEVPEAAGEVAFEAADGFFGVLALGAFAGDVGLGLGVAAQAGDGDAVDGGVDLAVAAAVEAGGGGVFRGGPGWGGGPRPGGACVGGGPGGA